MLWFQGKRNNSFVCIIIMELKKKGHFRGLQQLKLLQRFVCSNEKETPEIDCLATKRLRLINIHYPKLKIPEGNWEGMNTSVTSLSFLPRTFRALILQIWSYSSGGAKKIDMEMEIWVSFWDYHLQSLLHFSCDFQFQVKKHFHCEAISPNLGQSYMVLKTKQVK